MSSESVTIAGIFDTSSFFWGEHFFNFTVAKLKSENPAYQSLNSVVVDAACDETTAVRAYWKLRTDNNNVPVHGIVGARCSGASVSLARIAGLEKVNMVSPSSTSSILSDVEEFPYFSRLVAPDDSRGEVGALVETLKWFDWSRVSILSTDTIYAKDYVSEFRKLWEGEASGQVTYSNVIRLDANGDLDMASVDTALGGVPTDDPANNSRIILLVVQNQHAWPILKRAEETNFQPDTVWVGTSSWVGRSPTDSLLSEWVGREHPGYLGLGPIRHPNADEYLEDFNNWAPANMRLSQMPVFAAEMIDSITALVLAIYQVPSANRRDGDRVRQQLWQSSVDGASGSVRFTSEGDRRDPMYSILHLQRDSAGHLGWVTVGESGTLSGSATADLGQICWATLGCSLATVPSDSYPVPPRPLPTWIVALLVVVIILFLAVAIKYWRSRKSKQKIKKELETFRDSVVGMRTAEALYLPSVASRPTEDSNGGTTQSVNVQWCWKETEMQMYQHDQEEIVGDQNDCWIKYSDDANTTLEAAFKQQGWKGSASPLPGYLVDFSSMTQTKQQTGFTREVQRLVDTTNTSTGGSNDPLGALPASVRGDVASSEVKFGEELPEDIKNEPQMVLVPGDVIQISKQKKDTDWAFGTKLYHHDENVARSIVSGMTSDTSTVSSDEDEVNVFADTGWFQMEATRVPTTEDLQALKRNVGDTDALNAPSHWNDVADPSVVQVQELKKDDSEYQKVERAFKSSLFRKVTISSIKRVENLAMWQSFVVKRQTILSRELGDAPDADTSRQRQRLERCWLWHGTNVEVMDKILQQGFNRSFCGKNATVYGKGVYFARDTSYSASPTYAVKDSKGYQYIMACRVAVGEYCPGVTNALTPDIRDAKTHTLYDSTVGLLSGDSMSNPSIYVTYHDSQAYPEYLIKFKA
mmetsp:Transcript_21478/g.52918  ORF Transcript_21478/g.52918 Transcript_21478/m.52918 type:complete len:924 (-) Transcript_21478:2660-5431(-)